MPKPQAIAPTTEAANWGRSRGQAKRDLFARCHVVANTVEKTANDMRATLGRLQTKEITEWEAVEAIHQDVFSLLHECGLTEMVASLVRFQMTDFTARVAGYVPASEVEQHQGAA